MTVTLKGWNTGSTLNPCVLGTPICSGAVQQYDGYVGTGRQFQVSVGEQGYIIGADGSPPVTGNDDFSISYPPGITPGGVSNAIGQGGYSYNSGTAQYQSSEVANSPGTYTVSWNMTGTNVPSNPCSQTFTVADQPFVQVHGGDVVAGSGVEPQCNANPSAGIAAWNSNDGFSPTQYNIGAGVQYAAEAMNAIDGFVSAQNLSPGAAATPNGLSFANSTGTFGGLFNGGVPCDYNYNSYEPYSSAAALAGLGQPNPQSGYSASSTGCDVGQFSSSGIYACTGNITLNEPSVPNGSQITVYVNGNVYIPASVTYSGVQSTNPNLMTSFRIIATGDIDIDGAVSTLDGQYITQNGTINTCSDGAGNVELQSVPSGTCFNQLTVNGALVANTVNFQRVYGTLGTDTTLGVYAPGSPAEIINYDPTVWLAKPSTPMADTFDAVSNLPPVLPVCGDSGGATCN